MPAMTSGIHPTMLAVGQILLDLQLDDGDYLVPQADTTALTVAGARRVEITHRPGPFIPNRGLLSWDENDPALQEARLQLDGAPERTAGVLQLAQPTRFEHAIGTRVWSNLYVVDRSYLTVADFVAGGAPIVLIEGEGRESILHAGALTGGTYEEHVTIRVTVAYLSSPPTGWTIGQNAWLSDREIQLSRALRTVEQTIQQRTTLNGACVAFDDPAIAYDPDLPDTYGAPLIGAALILRPWGLYD